MDRENINFEERKLLNVQISFFFRHYPFISGQRKYSNMIKVRMDISDYFLSLDSKYHHQFLFLIVHLLMLHENSSF